MASETGGYAFPTSEEVCLGNEGMSLRDYFAAQVLGGMIGQERTDSFTTPAQAKAHLGVIAAGCYAMADAMLAERAKGVAS